MQRVSDSVKLDALNALRIDLHVYFSRPDNGTVRDAFGGDEHHIASNKAYLINNPCDHIMSLKDEEYAAMVADARCSGPQWKGRARDLKGQFYKTRFEDGVVQGWSLRMHKYVLVIPWSVQKEVNVMFEAFNDKLAKRDGGIQEILHKQRNEQQRDYYLTAGRRATDRCLTDRPHRQSLEGRRNHFTSVPKTL